MFVTAPISASPIPNVGVYTPLAYTQPRVNNFWQIVRGIAPPWNTKYGSCVLPGSTQSVFFGGSIGSSDVWLCDPRPPPGRNSDNTAVVPLWTKIELDASGSSAPAPRLFPLMVGLSPTSFIVAGGAGLTAPWTTFTDAFVGILDLQWGTVKWQPVLNAPVFPGDGEFTYGHSDHAPLATTGTFMRTIEGVLVSVMPVMADAFSHVHDITTPSAQKNALVVTVYSGDPENGGVRAQYQVVRYAAAPFSGAWPSSHMQSVRLVPLVNGFAFGYVVPRSRDASDVTGAATWILWLSCSGLETGTPSIRYTWTNLGVFKNSPTLRSGAAVFHTRANTPNGAIVAIYGGTALWTPRSKAAGSGVLPAVNDQGRALLPLSVGIFTKNHDGTFSFIWQNPYNRQTPPVASDQPFWDGDVIPSEAPAFLSTNVDTLTVGFVHYGGFWRSPTTNATTITVVSVPRLAVTEGLKNIHSSTQPIIRFSKTGEAFALPNFARI